MKPSKPSAYPLSGPRAGAGRIPCPGDSCIGASVPGNLAGDATGSGSVSGRVPACIRAFVANGLPGVSILLMLACSGCAEPELAHSYIPSFDPKELAAFGLGEESGVMVGGQTVSRPPGGPLREGEEAAMQAAAGKGEGREQAGRRSPAFRPDRVTELEGTLGYFEVFTPAVAPFKRVSALDGVALLGSGSDAVDRNRASSVPVLGVSDDVRRSVPVLGVEQALAAADGRERDRFWGSVVLDFSEGHVLPLPTVSPESRILSASTEPPIQVQFERDGADNFYVSAPSLAANTKPRQVRLTYVIDAPRSYFGAALPMTPSDQLAGEVPELPARVKSDALRFARELKLTRGMPVGDVLRTLAAHFRAFEESAAPPEDSGNIFLDLARSKRGVCRHRSYAFVITAQALGIPARFVQNEAHAWVEVKVADVGWMRLDLGGAAEGLDVRSLRDRPNYRPSTPDPWPRPLEYEASYSRAAELARDKAAKPGLERGDVQRAPSDRRLKPTLAAGQGEQSVPLIQDDREPITLRIARYVPEVMRGGMLEVDGAAQDVSGQAVPGLRIEVSLAEAQGDRAVLLGVTVTDKQGRFRGAFAIPPALDPSDYALVIVTPGDAKHAAARAE